MGLLRTAGRTAVAVRTAHAVHDRVERRKQAEWVAQGHPGQAFPAHQPAPTPTAPPPPPTGSEPAAPPGAPDTGMAGVLAQLKELGELRSAGVLTEEEFEAQKRRILAS